MIGRGAWLCAVLATATTAAAPSFWLRQGRQSSETLVVERPALVIESLRANDTLYYFGVGSNLLRSKIENRGVNGSKIDILHMEPAVVPNHRLSFRMRGFVPLEPGMGSLEPVPESVPVGVDRDLAASSSTSPFIYAKPECHGALVALTSENYEKVMRSEGVGPNSTNPGYEEVVVTAIPYDRTKPPVQAIALRARHHVRLSYDPCPSSRYLSILQQGAAELKLVPDYQDFLQQHPVQQTPHWLKRLAIYNLMFTFAVSTKLKWRGPSRWQSWLLSHIYVPSTSTAPDWKLRISHWSMACVLFSGACGGLAYQCLLQARGQELPPMIQRFVGLMSDNSTLATATGAVAAAPPPMASTTTDATSVAAEKV